MRKHKRIIILFIVIVLVVGIILLFRSCYQGKQPTEKTNSTDSSLDFTPASEGNNDKITIPAITGIDLKAGQLHQNVNFSNPSENNCYFQIQLYLSDNTLIWKSELIKPSENITEIELLQPLDKGTYGNCQLLYCCFSLDNKKPLNSGKIILEINSK